MSSSDSGVDEPAAAVYRGILGVLLAAVALVGAIYWVFDLLREGVKEGQ